MKLCTLSKYNPRSKAFLCCKVCKYMLFFLSSKNYLLNYLQILIVNAPQFQNPYLLHKDVQAQLVPNKNAHTVQQLLHSRINRTYSKCK